MTVIQFCEQIKNITELLSKKETKSNTISKLISLWKSSHICFKKTPRLAQIHGCLNLAHLESNICNIICNKYNLQYSSPSGQIHSIYVVFIRTKILKSFIFLLQRLKQISFKFWIKVSWHSLDKLGQYLVVLTSANLCQADFFCDQPLRFSRHRKTL